MFADHWGRLSYLFLLFFGNLHSNGCIFTFLLCFSLLFFCQLFVRPSQTAILLFCISFSWGCSWSLPPVQCQESPSIVPQALCLSDLIPWIYFSLPLYNHKGFDLGHTWTPKKRCPFHYRGLECKSKKSRNTWSNRQIWPWNTEWSRAKANRVLPRECTGHSKHPLPTTQETTLHMDITRWSILKSDWLYSLQPKMEKLYTVKQTRLWLRSWTAYYQIQT